MYDVAIVGAGVVGACTARELSRFALKTIVLEKNSDVAMGASRSNSGIVHAGYDAFSGTLKAKFNIEGQRMFDKLAEELDFLFTRNGSLVIINNKSDLHVLEQLKARGESNGLTDLYIVCGDKLRTLEPNLHTDIYAALVAPSAGIVNPYEMTIAFAENAAQNGICFQLDCQVTHINRKGRCFSLQTTQGSIEARVIINAAGLYSDEINNMLSADKLTIQPRRGEYCLLDKTEGALVKHTVFQLPSKMGKGILITPTVDGNLLVGPTSVDQIDKDNVATTMEGLAEVLSQAQASVKYLPVNKIITSFSGLRSHLVSDEFVVEEAPDVPGLINLCGIESPGLTAAPAIGAEVARMVKSRLNPTEKGNFNPIRKGISHFRNMTTKERKAAVLKNPDYGHIICRCETVTKAEISAALCSPLGVNNLDAIKRRVRAGMGRCQGGFCWMRLLDIIADESGLDLSQITKYGGQSNILVERNKSSF
jgi:glycerol-3-phosphate dehydrogenase